MKILDKVFQRGREFLGVDYPILCGAMTWISDPTLVSTVSNAGGFGCLAGGNAPVDILEKQIAETRALTKRPFAVNIITIAPAYQEHLTLLERVKVPYVIFAGSFPREKEVKRMKATGAKVLCFASTDSIAYRMLNYGADGLILEGMEAGGHVGHVSLMVLLQQLLFQIKEVPVFVAGGIGTGRMCAHLFLMGAAGVQFGTVFAVSEESCAHPAFKEKFVKANARDAVSTPQFDSRLPVVAVRALRNRGLEDFGKLQLTLLKQMDEGKIGRQRAQEEVEKYWMGALRRAVVEGDIAGGSLMAGQSVGLVNSVKSVRQIIADLVRDTEAELARIKKLF
ncbi:MAG: nitronate monooxygenase [Candidatus Omnitrophica bacterium]|nr:nitronate monooxygenase [Candidatus Omnitrophota bacterium]